MTVALETSKRKFHALLDNLTTGPLTSNPIDSPASKRSRLSTPDDSPNATTKTTTLRVVSGSSTTGTAPTTGPSLAVSRRTGLTSTTHLIRQARLRGQAQAKALGRRVGSSSSTLSTSSTTDRGSEPNYTPWSHTAFLARLRTFADLRRWTSKPEPVNEVAWAKRGWICEDGQNAVACRGGCEARVVVALRPPRHDEATGEEIIGSEDFSVDVAEGVVERFRALIVDGHNEGCLWRIGGCKDDVYRLPMARPGIWQPRLRERYASFAKGTVLPDERLLERPDKEEEVRLLEMLGLDFFEDAADATSTSIAVADTTMSTAAAAAAAAATTAPDGNENSTDSTTQLPSTEAQQDKHNNRAAFAFALYGWHGTEEGTGNAMATCDACFRRIGLWLYASDQPTTANEEVEGEDTAMKLNLIDNHRDYCPWINAESQSMPGTFAGLAAWQILRRVVVNSAKRQESEEQPASANEVAVEGGAARNVSAADKADRDRVRFARLKELTKAMSFRGLMKKR